MFAGYDRTAFWHWYCLLAVSYFIMVNLSCSGPITTGLAFPLSTNWGFINYHVAIEDVVSDAVAFALFAKFIFTYCILFIHSLS